VHEIAAEREKVRLATLEPRAHGRPGLYARDPMPEKPGKARKEAGGDAQVLEQVQWRRHRGALRAQRLHAGPHPFEQKKESEAHHECSRRVSSDIVLTASNPCMTSRLASTLSGPSPDSGTSRRYFASTSAHSIPRGAEPRGKSTCLENRRPSFSVIVTVAPWWCGERSGYGGGGGRERQRA